MAINLEHCREGRAPGASPDRRRALLPIAGRRREHMHDARPPAIGPVDRIHAAASVEGQPPDERARGPDPLPRPPDEGAGQRVDLEDPVPLRSNQQPTGRMIDRRSLHEPQAADQHDLPVGDGIHDRDAPVRAEHRIHVAFRPASPRESTTFTLAGSITRMLSSGLATNTFPRATATALPWVPAVTLVTVPVR